MWGVVDDQRGVMQDARLVSMQLPYQCNAMLQSPYHTQLPQPRLQCHSHSTILYTNPLHRINQNLKRVSLTTRWHRQRTIFR